MADGLWTESIDEPTSILPRGRPQSTERPEPIATEDDECVVSSQRQAYTEETPDEALLDYDAGNAGGVLQSTDSDAETNIVQSFSQEHDFWQIRCEFLVRVYVKPRKILFTPTEPA